jgi:outer membrane receptor protein involved in Fe transport
VDFKANGDLLTLPGGTVAMAVGAEYRYEGYENNRSAGYLTAPVDPTNPYLNPPTAATANYVGQNSDIAIDDHRTVGSLFAELAIPVVGKKQNIPLFRQLDLSLAGRLERYSTVGSVAKPKFGATWAVNKWIHFRGSHSQSFLAPNMAETYPGYLYRFANTISDPYRYDVTRVNAVDGPGTTGRLDLRGGGQSLKPEKSKNSSLGVIISAPWIKGFTATIDVWKIQQSDAIAILGAQELLNRDQVALDAYVQGQLKSGKSIGQIDAGSGTSAYKGLNLINRATPNQDDLAVFAAWNATHSAALQRAPVGSVISIVDSFLNLAHREIKGADVELDYALPDSDRFGRFRINVAGSYTEKFMVQDTPGGAWTDYRWTNQALIPVPLWKGNATLSWSSKGRAWRMGVMASMQGTWQDRRLTTTSVVSQTLNSPDYISSNNLYIVPAQWYYNWFGSYRIHSPEHGFWGRLHNATLRAGINNVFDQKPALTGSSAPYETAGNILSIQGRTYYVEITKRL